MSTFSAQPNETAAKDTFLVSTNPTTNFGTNATLGTSASGGALRTSLLDWDLSSIPAGATCDSATLSLWSSASVAGAASWGIYVMIQTWTEAGANWNTYDGTNAWPGSVGAKTSGTDYETDAAPPTITYPVSSIDTEASADLTAGANLTAAKVASKFGATLMISIGQTGSANRFWHSSNATTPEFRPKLVIVYTEGAAGVVGPLLDGRLVKHGILQGRLV